MQTPASNDEFFLFIMFMKNKQIELFDELNILSFS